MNKHTFAKIKLFECIGVKVGIYSPYSHYVKDIRSGKKTAGNHLDGAIERAWSILAMNDNMKKYVASWDVMILATSVNKDLESETAFAIASEYFGNGNTDVLTSLFLDGIKQSNKELRMISHLDNWA
jgi:hypothetical protein